MDAFSFLVGVISLIFLIVFFVMASNIGTAVKLLRAILKELKGDNPNKEQKTK